MRKILPLLQEYFYEDWRRIQIVLRDIDSDGRITQNSIVTHKAVNLADFNGMDAADLDGAFSYQICDENGITPDSVRKIYE
jgi:5-methylcytosine-specific restriction enzyme B